MMGGGSEAGPEVLPWLKSMPLAPEYHPSLLEFQDPIAYICKIEKEASQYGICKIIPPFPPASKKASIAHLNRSLASLNSLSEPTFSTRRQQIGWCPRKQPHPIVRKSVWQSGESYTLKNFEEKAKHFTKSKLRKKGTPLSVESLFWKATADKPFSVEYGNDLPGSAFGEPGDRASVSSEDTLGRSAWNMRAVSRARDSLLRFMPEEIPGVTSPMVYIAMLFSWFAWHVEDHDLHSLNYLHLGAPKTWYGIPRDAAFAFEDVVRDHGYGGGLNPLVAFATLGEKTTVLSPEILIAAGVPCCRLVQNVGEFVVTFPRSYHSGFSHGFNCGEAANIATPEWLVVAKEAAIRRASINHPPLVSHFQLLYMFALASSSRYSGSYNLDSNLCNIERLRLSLSAMLSDLPRSNNLNSRKSSLRSDQVLETIDERISTSVPKEPHSLRLKDKKRSGGEYVVRELFIQDVIQTSELLHVLYSKGSMCMVLPPNDLGVSSCSKLGKEKKMMSSSSCNSSVQTYSEATPESMTECPQVDLNDRKIEHIDMGNRSSSTVKYLQCEKQNRTSGGKQNSSSGDLLLEQGFFSCVTCGILGFACMAVIQPSELSVKNLLSRDCGYLSAQIDGSGLAKDKSNEGRSLFQNTHFASNGSENVVQDAEFVINPKANLSYDNLGTNGASALNLLAVAYGDTSDSEEDADDHPFACHVGKPTSLNVSISSCLVSSANETPVDPGDALLNTLNKSGTAAQSIEHVLKSQDEVEVSASAFDLEGDSERTIEIPKEKLDNGIDTSEHSSRGVQTHTNFSQNIQHLLETDSSIRPVENMLHKMSDSYSLIEDEQATVVCNEIKVPINKDTVPASQLTSSTLTCNELLKTIQDDLKVASVSLYSFSRCVPKVNSVENTHFRSSETQQHELTRMHLDGPYSEYSRTHVFCLEHAVEAQRHLEAIGGAHIAVLCHPDYPEVQEQAKLLAGEMGINHDWKDIEFKECDLGFLKKIQSALDDDLSPGNSDWAVKLSINLVYSANLSRTPLYSKQMPYNPILYKVFGCNLLENDVVGQGAQGKNNRAKKLVANKWCGKVWRANQLHPYIACLNGETSKQGDGFTSQSVVESEPEESTGLSQQESFSEANLLLKVCTSRRSVKRRMPFESSRRKRLKCPEWESSSSLHSPATPDESKCSVKETSEHSEVPTICYSRKKADHGNVAPKTNHSEQVKQEFDGGPSGRLRKRRSATTPRHKDDFASIDEFQEAKQAKSTKQPKKTLLAQPVPIDDGPGRYECDIEGCSMNFNLKQELALHKRNICTYKDCGKSFFSHKYLVQHRRVHVDDRPLKCPWKGCKKTFKWSWARTEHIRVHTGERPYVCKEAGCGRTFRFVSDFSRHKRRTGHSVKKKSNGVMMN